MRLCKIAAALALIGCTNHPAVAGTLPIASGEYVIASSPCADPAFAALLTYDGIGLGGPHVSRCTTKVLSRHGAQYKIATTCTAAGDGTPASPTTITQGLTIVSPKHIVLLNFPRSSGKTDYRWCSAAAR